MAGAGLTRFGVHDDPLEGFFADPALSAIHDAGVDGEEMSVDALEDERRWAWE
ncbi:hypothetical protein [Haloglomus halophilum]|uniref:hypothetical protein n=1 Tax=Haloglomus halophilum TaxID=2962672 RepID=UPI0020C9B94B|nr:hypothetical protein [Haloglomus halophilum]